MSHHDELEEHVAVSYELQDLRIENEQLKRSNADLLAALEAVRGLATVSQDCQLGLIARDAINRAKFPARSND